MNLLNKKIMIVLSFIIAISLFTASCVNKPLSRSEEDMVLKISKTAAAIEHGIESPWYSPTFISSLSYRALFITDPKTEEINFDLAKSCDVSEDGLIYEITLKENQLWSDCELITPEDVIFSIESIFGWEVVNSMFLSCFDSIVGASEFRTGEAKNITGLVAKDNKLTITLEKPIGILTKTLAQFAILPKHILGDVPSNEQATHNYWLNPVVSGMYNLTEIDNEKNVTYTYNENYSGQAPYINSILFSSEYKAEDFDYYDTNDVYSVFDYRAVNNKKEFDVDSIFYRYLIFNILKGDKVDPVMDDIRVRTAIIKSVDFEKIINSTYFNIASFYDSNAWKNGEDVEGALDFSYDPEAAKNLLLEADYDFDRPLVLLDYYTDETSDYFMNLVRKYLEDVGFTVEMIPEGDLFKDEFDNYDVALKGLSAFDMTEWYTEYHSSHALTQLVWGGAPIFDDLIEELFAVSSPEQKKEIEFELQKLENMNVFKYPLFTMGYKVYVNEDRIDLPEDIEFGNPRFRYDVDFENWKIIE